MAKVNLTTENAIVNAVGEMAFTGNIISENWYKTVVSSNGRVNLLAVNLLAEIVYWYKPMEIRDERTGDVTWEKKFADKDYLQKSYAQICDKYNVSVKQAREALIVLETLGVVKRHFRTVETEMGKCPNVMYLELIPEVLYALTYSGADDADGGKKGKTASLDCAAESEEEGANYEEEGRAVSPACAAKREDAEGEITPEEGRAVSLHPEADVFTKKETYPSRQGKSNTKSTTETTTEITTTAQARNVVAKAMEIFAPLGLSKKDIRAIAKASRYDLDRCMAAKAVYDAQRNPIGNATGWLIAAVSNNYALSSRIPPAKNPFNNFSQQIYTPSMIDALEEELLSANDCL